MTDLNRAPDVREPDRLPGAKIAALIAATFAIVVVAALGVWLAHPRGGESASSAPSLAGRGSSAAGRAAEGRGGVEVAPADLFSQATAHELRRDQQRLELERWQWSDRDHHRARRPLAAAIDAYLAEVAR